MYIKSNNAFILLIFPSIFTFFLSLAKESSIDTGLNLPKDKCDKNINNYFNNLKKNSSFEIGDLEISTIIITNSCTISYNRTAAFIYINEGIEFHMNLNNFSNLQHIEKIIFNEKYLNDVNVFSGLIKVFNSLLPILKNESKNMLIIYLLEENKIIEVSQLLTNEDFIRSSNEYIDSILEAYLGSKIDIRTEYERSRTVNPVFFGEVIQYYFDKRNQLDKTN